MFNFSKKLGLFALVCTLAGLAGCGGGSGTDNKKVDLLVCSGTDIIVNGQCTKPVDPPPCEPGYYRRTPTSACIKSEFVMPTKPEVLAPDEAVIYINRASAEKDFTGYSLYTWQACSSTWLSPSNPDANGVDNWNSETINPITGNLTNADPVYGAYFIVKLKPGGTCGSFIIRTPGRATQTSNLKINTAGTGPLDRRFFVIENPETGLEGARTSSFPICINNVCEEYEKPPLAISDVSAHWVTPTTILWDKTVTGAQLYAANEGATITAGLDGNVVGGTLVGELSAGSISADDLAQTPHLASFKPYTFNTSLTNDQIKELLKNELVIVGESASGKIGTRIQNYALLDVLYTKGTVLANTADANEAKLGVVYNEDNTVTVSVWAPTARNMELRIFSETPTPSVDGSISVFPLVNTVSMSLNSATGIWSYTGARADLDRRYYRFRVTGYNQFVNFNLVLEVPDPYAVTLAADGLYSQIVDLRDADLKPAGWDDPVPEVASPESMSIYETHVRDFSILDESTPKEHRGKYLAFTDTNSAPVQHLIALQQAGLTHIHLLPINDGSEIRERASKKADLTNTVHELCSVVSTASVCANKGEVQNVNANNIATLFATLKEYPGDSDKARKLMESLAGIDGFNWNYDPQYFNAPEGNYSTNPNNGLSRVREVREMNNALHKLGLRVVLDVVYPHMAASGIETANTTFDRIVPGYYFRVNTISGSPITDTGAGPDTATERAMMGKFLNDSVVQWAEQYKVDGFRFDQSGYIPKSVLVDAFNSVKAVDPDNYFYAEAWTASGTNAAARVTTLSNQQNLAGTGIGTFNDRIRDPLRNMNLVNGGELNAVRASLAGNLAAFKLLSRTGKTITAESVGAYNVDPQEAINYVEKHDGATLWDYMHLPNALPAGTTAAQRARIQALTLSVPLLSQGVPFIQMGSDLLRSKSMDSNSYNSGDWFNFVDFTKQTNNWMVGLPPQHSASDADILAAFADPEAKPTSENIQAASDIFNDFLAIGKTKLFSLQTAAEVLDRVGFHDGGKGQVNNVIVMSIDDGVGTTQGDNPGPRLDLDTSIDAVVVVFNGTGATINRNIATSTGFTLHSVQQASKDAVVKDAHFTEGASVQEGGTFTVPAYTTAVFVKVQNGAQGEGLLSTITSGYEPPVPYGDDGIYVRGGFPTGWSATGSNQMTYEGRGIYAVYLDTTTVPATNYGFLVGGSAGDFSDHKFGFGAITLDTPTTLVKGGGDISISLPAGNYRFQLDATNADSPILTVTDADTYKATPLYARGLLGEWNENNAVNLMVYQGRGIYDLVAPADIPGQAGVYEFKFGAAGWDPQLGSIAGEGRTMTLNTAKSLVSSGGQNLEIAIPLSAAGKYSIRLDVADTSAPFATVYKNDLYSGTAIYVRGSVYDGWSADAGNQLAYEGHGRYSKALSLTANTAYEFKIASSDWSTVNMGVADILTQGASLELESPGGNISFTPDITGNYKFTLDTAATPHSVSVVKVP